MTDVQMSNFAMNLKTDAEVTVRDRLLAFDTIVYQSETDG